MVIRILIHVGYICSGKGFVLKISLFQKCANNCPSDNEPVVRFVRIFLLV